MAEITDRMLRAGLDAMRRTMRPDAMPDDFTARDRMRIVSEI
jgi:hypothetical protein